MYKLLKSEIKNLDNYWKFIETFYVDETKDLIDGVYGYRHDLIKKIREKYTAEDFYKYENILNKLLWNLIEHIKFDIHNIKINNFLFTELKYNKPHSYSHKLYLYNEKYKTKYYFNFYLDIEKYEIINKIFTILTNRKLYEKVMKNKSYINKIKLTSPYYYPRDYAFPNVNLIFYNENKKETWVKNINKLYFNDEGKEINNNWYTFGKNI
jgi:hypothetical protein